MPSSEKDRAMAVIMVVVVPVLKIRRLETIVVIMGKIVTVTYAINVNITSRITPVIQGLRMIWTLTDTATTVCREKPVE